MNRKYEFTGETKVWCGITLRRIRATIDFTLKCGMGIAKGEEGGWIEKEENLSQEDSAWVCGNAQVCGDAQVYGNAQVYGDAWVYGDARVCGDAWVYGDARVCGDAQVYGDARVCGNAQVYGDAWVCGNAQVTKLPDIIWFKNIWTSGRAFTYTRSNKKWSVGCFHGTGEELIKKAYADSELSGKCYEATVKYVEEIYKALDEAEKAKGEAVC